MCCLHAFTGPCDHCVTTHSKIQNIVGSSRRYKSLDNDCTLSVPLLSLFILYLQLCIYKCFMFDLTFSGIVPLAEEKTVCAQSEKFYKMCKSDEVR